MLDYKELSNQVEEILSSFDNEKIQNWLYFDQKRIESENFINGRKINITIQKTSNPKFKEGDQSYNDSENQSYNWAA